MKRFVTLTTFVILTLFYVQPGFAQFSEELKGLRGREATHQGQARIELVARSSTAPGPIPRLAVSMEVVSNTFDGSARIECEAQDEIESGKKHEAWLAFGGVKPQGERGWKQSAPLLVAAAAPLTRRGRSSGGAWHPLRYRRHRDDSICPPKRKGRPGT